MCMCVSNVVNWVHQYVVLLQICLVVLTVFGLLIVAIIEVLLECTSGVIMHSLLCVLDDSD